MDYDDRERGHIFYQPGKIRWGRVKGNERKKCETGGLKEANGIVEAGMAYDAAKGLEEEEAAYVGCHYKNGLYLHGVGVDGEVFEIVADKVGHDIGDVNSNAIVNKYYPAWEKAIGVVFYNPCNHGVISWWTQQVWLICFFQRYCFLLLEQYPWINFVLIADRASGCFTKAMQI